MLIGGAIGSSTKPSCYVAVRLAPALHRLAPVGILLVRYRMQDRPPAQDPGYV